jgi:hypothetical protein
MMRAALHTGRKVLREAQPAFTFEPPTEAIAVIPTRPGLDTIEHDAFPFEARSDVAELESSSVIRVYER